MTANVPATILVIKKILSGSAIGQCDLVRIYISVIRPVVEYACPAWHTNLPQYVSDNIELIQKRCMKTIFPGCSYNDILEMTNLPTLHDRRTSSCRTYFNTISRSRPKGPATRNDFVNDIVNDARADAIFATLKAIVDDEKSTISSTISLRVAWP